MSESREMGAVDHDNVLPEGEKVNIPSISFILSRGKPRRGHEIFWKRECEREMTPARSCICVGLKSGLV